MAAMDNTKHMHRLVGHTQIREKKKLVSGLKEQLRELNMSTAVETRFMEKVL
jgi:hypothetical protein